MKYSYINKLYLSRYANTRVIDNKYYETSNKIVIPESEDDLYYTISAEDDRRLDILAHKFYGNAKYYWMIALANNIIDPIELLNIGTTVRIPDISHVSSEVGGKE